MMADKPTNARRVPDFLLSWDRLGFRLLVFGSLALAWILQGLLASLPWQKLVVTEVEDGPLFAHAILRQKDQLLSEALMLRRQRVPHRRSARLWPADPARS